MDQIGTFTMGFDHASYPRADNAERLHVAYGQWDGPVSYTHLTLPTNREV